MGGHSGVDLGVLYTPQGSNIDVFRYFLGNLFLGYLDPLGHSYQQMLGLLVFHYMMSPFSEWGVGVVWGGEWISESLRVVLRG